MSRSRTISLCVDEPVEVDASHLKKKWIEFKEKQLDDERRERFKVCLFDYFNSL